MVTTTDLKNCYNEACKKEGLIEFTAKIRGDDNKNTGKYSVKIQDLTTLFSANVWKDCKKKGGHRKIQNIVTKVVVEYATHCNDVDPGAVLTILEAVQKHLNILHNDVFSFNPPGWREPDYNTSLRRLHTLNL